MDMSSRDGGGDMFGTSAAVPADAAASVAMMAYVLQSTTSTVDEQIAALRALKQHLDAELGMDAYSQKRIKQVILDSVLRIILNEDRITNIVKRQLVRTELLLVLGKLLSSETLFGSVIKKSPAPVDDMSDITSVVTDATSIDTRSEVMHPTTHSKPLKPVGQQGSNSSDSEQWDDYTTADSATSAMIDRMKQVSRTVASASTARRLKLMSRTGSSVASSSDNRSTDTTTDISMLAPSIEQSFMRKKRYLRSKAWRARPTVLYSDSMQEDSIAPGSDPLNYLQQDIKLGYQKPRMWFPGSSMASANTILPADRSAKEASGGSDQVVREYLQMRALASYVGDLVSPFVPTKDSSYMSMSMSSSSGRKKQQAGGSDEDSLASSTGSKFRLANITDNSKFAQAMAEASAIWSPLLGLHLPPHHRDKLMPGPRRGGSSVAIRADSSSYVGPYRDLVSLPFRDPAKSLRSGMRAPSRGTRIGPLLEHRRDPQKKSVTSIRIPHLSDVEQYDSHSYSRRSAHYQQRVARHLHLQREHILASIRATEALIAATIGLQYARLHPNYLLLIEGQKANQRQLLANCLGIFCRVRMRNLQQLVFGIWKILLVVQASKARLPQYARIVSCHLMARWRDEVHVKKLRKWVIKWRRGVSVLIFLERYRRVIALQTLYRTWRDRRKLVRMHLVKPYLGVLSDIYLAPTREDVLFAIPEVIRNERRLIWAAATRIQTKFRSWIASRDYFYRLRMLVLIQSVCRMFPIYRKFKRLKATTIKCQAWSRRTVKVKQYRRLKRCTIVVQKYVRRYLSTLLKWRHWSRAWAVQGLPIAAAITIQCRWRIHKARKVTRSKVFHLRLLVYSALVIQRSYFRYRRAFHTFFLMCALRRRGEEDLQLERLATSMGKTHASRTLVRYYRQRFKERIVVFVLKVQSWFRGRRAHFYVCSMRREKWACRKLRHWMRCTVLRRHRCARRIQRCWWSCKKGRLMRHLWQRAALSDLQALQVRDEQQYWAAVRMQAYVKGVWDRRYVRRLRAALVMQKYVRFYFGLKRWRRWKLYQIKKKVSSFLDRLFKKVLSRRTEDICQLHAAMLRRPQAWIRGYLVRAVFRRAREYAYTVGMAALRIQRCWRTAGVVSKAIEEMMALRRKHDNPFKRLSSPHEVLLEMSKLCSSCYSPSDPRVGLKLTGFLHRLGLIELLEMFPKKRFAYPSDLQSLDVDQMAELYSAWRAKVDHAVKGGGGKKDNNSSKRLLPNEKAPLDKLRQLVDLTRLPYPPKTAAAKEKLRALMAVPEYYSPSGAAEMIRGAFARKFGKTLSTKADKVAMEMVEASFGQFNNYRTVGLVLTRPLMLRAINRSSDSNAVLEAWSRGLEERQGAADEKKWDKLRTAKGAEILQFAVDRLDAVLPSGGVLRGLLSTANAHMLAYKRKVGFLRKKLSETNNSRTNTPNKLEPPVRSNLSADNADTPPSVAASLGLHYLGSLQDLELELNVSACKVFDAALMPLLLLTCAVQRLKSAWRSKGMRRVLRAQQISAFLSTATAQYKHDRTLNKVKHQWEKNRRLQQMQKKVALLLEAVQQRRRAIEFSLSFVPRAGWVAEEDHYGNTYWLLDDPKAVYEPVHEMPVYSYEQWLRVLQIQAVARIYLLKLAAIRQQRWEDEQREIERIAALLEEEKRNNRKLLSVRCSICSYADAAVVEGSTIGQSKVGLKLKGIVSTEGSSSSSSSLSVEEFLPWRFRFDSAFRFTHGAWVLFQSAPKDSSPVYEVAVMFRLDEKEGVCDVRNVKGQCFRRVKLWRISQMPLDVGTRVESRYQSRKLFYRSRVIHIDTNSDLLQPMYTVKYDDGEVEQGLRRDSIRPTADALLEFLQGRRECLPDASKRRDRSEHFAKMRRQRLQSPSPPAVHRAPLLLAIGDGSTEEREKVSEGAVVALASDGSLTVAAVAERTFIKIALRYTRLSLMFNWEAVMDDRYSSSEPAYFIHSSTNEISEESPLYAPIHVHMAHRIQLAWLSYQARKRVRRRAMSLNLMELAASSVREASKVAFIGFELEGVTTLQMLRRAGFWELSEAIEEHYKASKLGVQSLTIEEVARTAKDDYEQQLGVGQPMLAKALKEFQTWWGRASNAEKQKKLSFFNYYTHPDDPRSIQDCIRDSEETLFKKFSRVVKTGASRTRAAVQVVAGQSLFPHTHQQVDAYLKKYGDKPELARDCVHELVSKPTTHSWAEERQVLRIYKNTTRLVRAVLSTLRIERLYRSVCGADKHADQLLEAVDKGTKRVLCSGPEAKAALLLRVEVIQLLMTYLSGVVLVQKQVRCFMLKKQWDEKMRRRRSALGVIQCMFRVTIALNKARALMAEMNSEWEQLWDGRRSLLYYYNYVTGASQYEEPPCPFRPLIRDYYSAQLVQAWPHLDRKPGRRLPAWTGSSVSSVSASHGSSLCGVCGVRRTVRICSDCEDDDPTKHRAFPYCFPCFMKHHADDDDDRTNHQFQVVSSTTDSVASSVVDAWSVDSMTQAESVDGTSQLTATDQPSSLQCCMCDRPATRKCLGVLDEEQLETICSDLRRADPNDWMGILSAANIGGERKLTLLLEQFRLENAALALTATGRTKKEGKKKPVVDDISSISISSSPIEEEEESSGRGPPQKTTPTDAAFLTLKNLQSIRALLERMRAECDECYCAEHYGEVHAGGKRVLHRWVGFCEYAQVCSVCTNSPAELRCEDCDCLYCASCYQVFHGMGRKRLHRKRKVLEELAVDQRDYCYVCERRPVQVSCDNFSCRVWACDSCYLFKHKPECDRVKRLFSPGRKASTKSSGGSPQPGSGLSFELTDIGSDQCVVCGEAADRRCVQCKDCYCSRVWPGNAGCFLRHHSKGNRAAHSTEPFFSTAFLSRRAFERRKSMAASSKS